MSYHHLESFFSRIRRRGAGITIQIACNSKGHVGLSCRETESNANVSIEEPEDTLFMRRQSTSVLQANVSKYATACKAPPWISRTCPTLYRWLFSVNMWWSIANIQSVVLLCTTTQYMMTRTITVTGCADGTQAVIIERKDRIWLTKARVFKSI